MVVTKRSSDISDAEKFFCMQLETEVHEATCQGSSVVNNYYSEEQDSSLMPYVEATLAFAILTFLLVVAVVAYVATASGKAPLAGPMKSNLYTDGRI